MVTLHSTFRPGSKTKTGRVWVIADRISRETGRMAKWQEVVDAFVAEGGNRNTASTQYYVWKQEMQQAPVERPEPVSTSKVILQIGNDGRLLIPLELRSQMEIGADGKVTARVEKGELKVVSPRVALREIQRLVSELDKGQGSAVDELIAERRIEGNRS